VVQHSARDVAFYAEIFKGPMARTNINDLTSVQRQDLVTRMLGFINDAVVNDHLHITHSGAQLLEGHRAYIAHMENHLQQNGGGTFAPLPSWDPATTIPAEFDVVKPADDGTQLPPLDNLNPNMPLPAAFQRAALCAFQTAGDLGNAINGWHGSVHLAIGGAMGDAVIAPAAPIFWCWHAYLDDVYAAWLACASHAAPHAAPPEALPLNIKALSGAMPSHTVTSQLFKEWAEWSRTTLKLQQ
jgi:hypothetical protein